MICCKDLLGADLPVFGSHSVFVALFLVKQNFFILTLFSNLTTFSSVRLEAFPRTGVTPRCVHGLSDARAASPTVFHSLAAWSAFSFVCGRNLMLLFHEVSSCPQIPY